MPLPPPSPTVEQIAAYRTLEGLRELWRIRDQRYSLAKQVLDEVSAKAIRAGRAAEIGYLPREARQHAWSTLASWQPPMVRIR
jgi:hypothetical protein